MPVPGRATHPDTITMLLLQAALRSNQAQLDDLISRAEKLEEYAKNCRYTMEQALTPLCTDEQAYGRRHSHLMEMNYFWSSAQRLTNPGARRKV